jgi:hypothetical protein
VLTFEQKQKQRKQKQKQKQKSIEETKAGKRGIKKNKDRKKEIEKGF